MTTEQVRAALDLLESPDDESRSPEEQGRRIIRMDEHRAWGWLVVNYVKYRSIRDEEDRREQNRVAQEKWRSKHRKPQSAAVSQHKPQSAHTEADTEAVRDKQPTVVPQLADASVGKNRRPACPTEKIVSLYHEALPMCPRCEILTITRKAHISARWGQVLTENDWTPEQGIEWFAKFFAQMARSRFLTGRVNGRDGKPPFKATLDFLMRPESFAKAVEGFYRDKEAA